MRALGQAHVGAVRERIRIVACRRLMSHQGGIQGSAKIRSRKIYCRKNKLNPLSERATVVRAAKMPLSIACVVVAFDRTRFQSFPRRRESSLFVTMTLAAISRVRVCAGMNSKSMMQTAPEHHVKHDADIRELCQD